jgi:hypothetical protein
MFDPLCPSTKDELARRRIPMIVAKTAVEIELEIKEPGVSFMGGSSFSKDFANELFPSRGILGPVRAEQSVSFAGWQEFSRCIGWPLPSSPLALIYASGVEYM